jgi:hypothetical protein
MAAKRPRILDSVASFDATYATNEFDIHARTFELHPQLLVKFDAKSQLDIPLDAA